MSYRFKSDGVRPFREIDKVDPDIAGEIIDALDESDRPGELVKAAQKRGHHLHRIFEWNNVKAGHEYRLYQARKFISCLMWIDDDKSDAKPVTAFVSLPTKDGRQYHNVRDIVKNEELSTLMVVQAKDALLAWLARYEHLKIAAKPLVKQAVVLCDAEIKAKVC